MGGQRLRAMSLDFSLTDDLADGIILHRKHTSKIDNTYLPGNGVVAMALIVACSDPLNHTHYLRWL